MNRTPAPDRVFADQPVACGIVIALSLLLSVWFVLIDPVIDDAGATELAAAVFFIDGEWGRGLEMSGRPVYTGLVALLSGLTGISGASAAHVLNAGFHAFLVLGFVALGTATGGNRATLVMSAALILLFPALHGFRAAVTGDAAYWALYIWCVAGFLHYVSEHDRRSLALCVFAIGAALLFSLEALVLALIVAGGWCFRSGVVRRTRAMKFLFVGAGAAVFLCYLVWRQSWSGTAPAQLLLNPVDGFVDGWRQLGRAIGFKLESLRGAFLDQYSRNYDDAALAVALVLVSIAAVAKTLGLVYGGLALYGAAKSRVVLAESVHYWWVFLVVVSTALLLVPAVTRFSLGRSDAMIAVLTILAIVPTVLERLYRDRDRTRTRSRWIMAVVAALLLVTGLSGLDRRAERHYLRDAGMWLRATAPPGSSLYSNSPVVGYYSGLDQDESVREASWRQAMNLVWRGDWRTYDYLALHIAGTSAHREGILMRRIDARPVKVFTNGDNDRVLVFQSGG